jgi:hypothetical protein
MIAGGKEKKESLGPRGVRAGESKELKRAGRASNAARVTMPRRHGNGTVMAN